MKSFRSNPIPREDGFSLLELLAALGILLIISGATLSAVNYYQKNYSRTQQLTDMHSGVRGAVELMTQEISQAGLINSLDSTAANINASLSLSSTGSPIAQTVPVDNASLFYAGEELQVDTGANQETVVVASIVDATHISGIFTKNHTSGAALYAVGTIAEGVVPPPNPSTYDKTTCCDTLQIIGDVNGDGTLQFVEYKCDWSYVDGTGATVPSLTRSQSKITPNGAKSAAVALVKHIKKNPIPSGGTTNTPCFLFDTRNLSVTETDGTTLNYWYTTNVSLTLTVETDKKDLQTNQTLTMTKSFLDLSPRNVNGAYQLAQTSQPGRILARPTGNPTWLP